MVAACAVVSLNDATVKWLSTELPVGEIVCLRAAVAMSLGILFAWRERGRVSFRVSSPRLQLLRGLLAAGGMFLFVAGLRHLPLADAVAILFAAPLFSFVLAIIPARRGAERPKGPRRARGLCGNRGDGAPRDPPLHLGPFSCPSAARCAAACGKSSPGT